MKVQIIKYHLSGLLEGLKTTEKMKFVDWDSACAWAAAVTMNTKTSYVVLEMENMETKELAFF